MKPQPYGIIRVLPAVFGDELSQLEILAKLMDKQNEIIHAITTGEGVQAEKLNHTSKIELTENVLGETEFDGSKDVQIKAFLDNSCYIKARADDTTGDEWYKIAYCSDINTTLNSDLLLTFMKLKNGITTEIQKVETGIISLNISHKANMTDIDFTNPQLLVDNFTINSPVNVNVDDFKLVYRINPCTDKTEWELYIRTNDDMIITEVFEDRLDWTMGYDLIKSSTETYSNFVGVEVKPTLQFYLKSLECYGEVEGYTDITDYDIKIELNLTDEVKQEIVDMALDNINEGTDIIIDKVENESGFVTSITINADSEKINKDILANIKQGENIIIDRTVEGEITISATGGGFGTSDYNDLDNKPSINDVELIGNKTGDELGLVDLDSYNIKQESQDTKIQANKVEIDNIIKGDYLFQGDNIVLEKTDSGVRINSTGGGGGKTVKAGLGIDIQSNEKSDVVSYIAPYVRDGVLYFLGITDTSKDNVFITVRNGVVSKDYDMNPSFFSSSYVYDNVEVIFDGSVALDCVGLFNEIESENFTFNRFNTSNVTNMSSMFSISKGLNVDDLINFDTSNVVNMSSMFSSSDINEINLSNFDTSKVTDMSEMFYICGDLLSINLSNFDTSNVTSMYKMFSGCASLTTLDLSNFVTSNVTSMLMMFSGSNINEINLSNFDTSNVVNMSKMFSDCSKLTSLDLSNFDTSKVTNMSDMFYYCSKLTSLDLSNFDTSNVTDMSEMFYYCSKLTLLDLSNFDTSKVTNSYRMFNYCDNLLSINLSNAVGGITDSSLYLRGREIICTEQFALDSGMGVDKFSKGEEVSVGNFRYTCI